MLTDSEVDHASATATMPMCQANNAFTECLVAIRGRLIAQRTDTYTDDTPSSALTQTM